MNQKGSYKTLVFIIFVVVVVIITVYFVWSSDQNSTTPITQPETEVPIASVGEPQSVSFKKVDLHSDWRLKSSYNYSTYKGTFQNENELKKVWGSMVNAYDELQAFWEKKNENQPVMPVISFNKNSVIWYADRGVSASFVTMDEVIEYDDFIEAHIVLFYSDFGSSHLNLWTIPKTDKPVQFIETREYEERGA